MKRRAALLLATACLTALPALARQDRTPRQGEFRVALIGHGFRGENRDAEFRHLLNEAERAAPAFIIATGIKSDGEACSDRIYAERRALMDSAERPLVLLPAGSDWAACRHPNGSSAAVERLNRIREVFFPDAYPLGQHPFPLTRQSAIPKFRSYAENSYWEHEKVLFATLNAPARNNHYVTEAGRNSEYEDRMVANRAWLQRIFLQARRRNCAGIVLVTDGNLGAHAEPGFFAGLAQQRDGFSDTRRLVRSLAEKFPGKVLLVDSQKRDKGAAHIGWSRNIGHLSLGAERAVLRLLPHSADLFTLAD